MRLTRFVSALPCALILLAVPARAQQTAQKPITLAVIVDAMEAREKRFASVSVRWRHTEHWSHSERWRPNEADGDDGKPAEYAFPCEMLLKGDSMRYSSQTFWFRKDDIKLIDHISTWDGKESRYLQGGTPPAGRILKEKQNTDANTVHLLPLMLYFRPLADPPAKLNRTTLKLADGRKTIGGRECVAINDGHLRVDLDCTRDFIPVAFEAYRRDGRVYCDGTLEYYHRQDAEAWVPKAFEIRCRFGRTERSRGDSVQTAIGIPIEDSNFRLPFKPGTIVWDERTQEEYRLRDDGSKEPVGKPRRKRPAAK